MSYRGMFEPYLKSFYVRSNDPTQVKLLKLEILTNLAIETNISTILREFQTYVTSSDKEFAAATIQAIGRCASSISEITDACLNGLVSLLSNRDEAVVGESVVVIKKLLQMQPTEHKDIIIHMAKLADTITVPMARASILWLIGEYSDRVPKIAPDVLRKMAKGFVSEEDIVKLQILNLAAKLCIANSKQTKLLCQYIFNLAKYDQNYDIRDRARFLRQLILPGEKAGALAKHAKKIFLATKPAPVLESKYKDRDQFQLGTLSHIINSKAQGYQELPEWPDCAPDPAVRNVEVTIPWAEEKKVSHSKKPEKKKKSFYSSSESESSSETSGADSTEEGSTSSEESKSESGSLSESESKSEEELSTSDMEPPRKVVPKVKKLVHKDTSQEEEEYSTSSSESEDDSECESASEEEIVKKKRAKEKKKKEGKLESKAPTKPADMLLDLDFGPTNFDITPAISPGDLLTPSVGLHISPVLPKSNYNVMSPVFTPTATHELLNRITGAGLAASYKFTRIVSIFSNKMVSVEILFTNTSEKPMENIRMGEKKLQKGMALEDFPPVSTLAPNSSTNVLLGIDFNDTTQPAQFEIIHDNKKFTVSITAPVGELLQPNTLTENDFTTLQARLTGMNETTGNVELTVDSTNSQYICSRVYEIANTLQVPTIKDNVYYFASKTYSTGTDTLITVKVSNTTAKIIVNSEKMVIGSMLVKDLKGALAHI